MHSSLLFFNGIMYVHKATVCIILYILKIKLHDTIPCIFLSILLSLLDVTSHHFSISSLSIVRGIPFDTIHLKCCEVVHLSYYLFSACYQPLPLHNWLLLVLTGRVVVIPISDYLNLQTSSSTSLLVAPCIPLLVWSVYLFVFWKK